MGEVVTKEKQFKKALRDDVSAGTEWGEWKLSCVNPQTTTTCAAKDVCKINQSINPTSTATHILSKARLNVWDIQISVQWQNPKSIPRHEKGDWACWSLSRGDKSKRCVFRHFQEVSNEGGKCIDSEILFHREKFARANYSCGCVGLDPENRQSDSRVITMSRMGVI